MAAFPTFQYAGYPQGYQATPTKFVDPSGFNYYNSHLLWRSPPVANVSMAAPHRIDKREQFAPGLSGPPRKPKQSGYALWVGNLPPGPSLAALKDYFATGATEDILSVSVMSRSSCCFVNYRSEQACRAALLRFDQSLFAGFRLNCRMRFAFVDQVASRRAISPADLGQSKDILRPPVADIVIVETPREPTYHALGASSALSVQEATEGKAVPQKFFIMKSLTTGDLEESVRSGTWSTQSHNESKLDDAYSEADNVYFIFSANKSGEFFGYARMESKISQKGADTSSPIPSRLGMIRSQATATAPAGRILNDPSRGTLFWEVDSSNDDQEEPWKDASGRTRSSRDCEGSCAVRWLSTARVPFHLTRGLRNSWKY